jgi:hypothetical protein
MHLELIHTQSVHLLVAVVCDLVFEMIGAERYRGYRPSLTYTRHHDFLTTATNLQRTLLISSTSGTVVLASQAGGEGACPLIFNGQNGAFSGFNDHLRVFISSYMGTYVLLR